MPGRSRRRRIAVIVVSAAVVLLAAAWLALPRLIEPILRRKLEALVGHHLHAELHFTDLSYRLPYTVHLRGARLLARGGARDGDELFTLGHGTLVLDELPLGDGPLMIRAIELDRPALRVARESDGSVSLRKLFRHPQEDRGDSTDEQQQRMKLSDLFRLRRLTLREGQVTFADRMRPQAPPMVWQNLSTDMRIRPRQAAVYEFGCTAEAPGLARLSVGGAIDIDQLVLAVEQLLLTGGADAEARTTSLPDVLQRLVEKHQISGNLRIEAGGTLPLRDAASSSLKASIELRDARAKLWRGDRMLERLELKLACDKPADRQEIAIQVQRLAASAGRADVTLEQATGRIDLAAKRWRLRVPGARARFAPADPSATAPATLPVSDGSIVLAADLSGSLEQGRIYWDQSTGTATIRDVTLQPPGFPHQLTGINANLHLEAGAIRVEQLSGTYGEDAWAVPAARVLVEDLPHRVRVSGVQGSVRFGPPSPRYPGGVGDVIAVLKPDGPFDLSGDLVINRGAAAPPDQWDVRVSSSGGSFVLTDRNVPVTSIRGEARITRDSIEIRRFLGHVFDGAIACTGTIDPRKPVSYQGEVSVENVDLQQLIEGLHPSADGNFRATGRLGGSVTLRADRWALEALSGGGELLVHEGDLWHIPLLENIVREIKVADDALRAGTAAALVEAQDGVIRVHHAAVSSPALGLQGWGMMGLDGTLDLDVVVAPLGDWERQFRRLNIPIVNQVAGAVAGTMQKILNTATSQLLYEFRVTGTVSDPRLRAVPTPVLSEAAAMVFEGMLKREQDLLRPMRQRRPERRPRPEE